MKHLYSLVLTIALLVGSMSVATAQDLDKGLEAAQSGDFQTALQEWRPLAEQGDAYAQYNLAELYKTGKGVPQDQDQASIWYRLSAEQGHPFAMYQLGVYLSRKGDYSTASMWLTIAAGSGLEEAIHLVGRVDTVLTLEQQLGAARRAVACIDASYQNCE